ncbi:MAG: error-prone DNA polymerase, partial [Planctomycetota bacterium]
VNFARSRGILCQGRGGAANSAVCYCLGITEVDPATHALLFERFVSRERKEPPDIDIDFEHERREEVLQYIYETYGRERAAMTAEVISYRGRSAIREVSKAMGLSEDCIDTLAKNLDHWGDEATPERIRESGLNPEDRTISQILALTRQLVGFPRHLSQHVGGMVITRGPLCDLVPIENATMEDRTVIEWDKDDIDAMSMLKVDCLGLGMLTCIRKAFELLDGIGVHGPAGGPLTIADVMAREREDDEVYGMISRADTIGVFQIESRAQMSMLPRLKPRCFYDLVIEVAIVRPGPIQGGMVHPYLRRREGQEPVSYPTEAVRDVLERTLGVPLFQEQAMQLAIVAAGFTPDQADGLRRSMAAWKRKGNAIARYGEHLIEGMLANGYTRDFAERCFEQIKGFSEYGFPESHAANAAGWWCLSQHETYTRIANEAA